ncbi:MAG TPA: rod shape-determining protein MreC [Acidobacteriota bacterium]|nr:rod shape-determining protein MreC [Acidobacteriota bacterium]
MSEYAERKPFVSLLVVLLLQVILLSVQVRDQQGTLLIRSWSLFLSTPVASLLDWSTRHMGEGASTVSEVWTAVDDNRRLRQENARLKLEMSRLKEMAEMLPRTRAFQPLMRQFEQRVVFASVVWKSPPFFRRHLVINAGTRDGVRPDAAVLTPQGIAGRIWQGTGQFAEVELITNPGAAAGVLVGPQRVPGLVSGDGSALLRLEFISNAEKIEVGDQVLTSGTERIYPKGFSVGRVVRSEPGSDGRLKAWVEPAADLESLEEVAVILNNEVLSAIPSAHPGAAK